MSGMKLSKLEKFDISFSVHIPRVLGFCVLLFGVCGIITSIPQFVFERQDLGGGRSSTNNTTSGLCVPGMTSEHVTEVFSSVFRRPFEGSHKRSKFNLMLKLTFVFC